MSRSFIFKMRIVSDIIRRENQNTHFMFGNFYSKNCATCEIMWKKYCRATQTTDNSIIRRIRFARRTTKATEKHLQNTLLVCCSIVPQHPSQINPLTIKTKTC